MQPGRLKDANDVDDATLVAQVKMGNMWAMEALYHRYVHKVTGISAKLLRNGPDIEDVVQDTFIEAFRDMVQLREPHHVERWLVRIAIHRAHRRFRRRKLKRTLGLDRSIDDECLADQARTDASQEARAEIALLDSVFDSMRLAERTCYVLRCLEGYHLDEVAQMTGCSLATVKRRVSRAQQMVAIHFPLRSRYREPNNTEIAAE